VIPGMQLLSHLEATGVAVATGSINLVCTGVYNFFGTMPLAS
jgi:hypothetical protein